MSSAGGQKPPVRKFPPPCWSRDEALVLIEAYRERWHALNRAFLRTPDWDLVADKLTAACPDVTPPKTPAQCRHKMEKLRQRHRAEKQRAAAFSGEHFSSTWFYYEAMETMENGSNSKPGPNPGHGIRVKPLPLEKFTTLPPNSKKHRTKPKPNPNHPNRYSPYPNNNSVGIPYQENGYKRSSNIGAKPAVMRRQGGSRKCSADGRNAKRDGGVADVVASIRLLGEGFMKAEKMKIDVVREIERMRMETEMRWSEVMLESQRRIVGAFVEGLMEYRKV